MEELRKLKKELQDKCITLPKFLFNYCGIYSEELHKIKISHQDVKELMPNLKRVSFESLLGNIKSIYIGDIIPVKDSYENVVPYVNPMLDIQVTYEEIACDLDEEFNIDEIIIDENLKNYELVKLCTILKEHNKRKEYREVNKILKKKKEPKIKKYKREKEFLKIKGRGNDEY